MSRKPDPERIYESRRAAILSRLLGTGMDRDRAEARVADWEAMADAEGRDAALGRVLGRGRGLDGGAPDMRAASRPTALRGPS